MKTTLKQTLGISSFSHPVTERPTLSGFVAAQKARIAIEVQIAQTEDPAGPFSGPQYTGEWRSHRLNALGLDLVRAVCFLEKFRGKV